jgi:hypothetical protein
MHNLHKELLESKRMIYFIILSLLLIIITYIIQSSFYNEEVFYNTYIQQLSVERAKKIYQASNKWQLISLLFLPVTLLVKTFYNSFWITAGSILNNERGGFKSNYNICLKAEYVFMLMLLVKFIWLLTFKQVNTLNDLSFIPGAVINVYSIDKIPKWLIYPLQTLNIWELMFCIVGTTMYSTQYNVSKVKAMQLFCIPYLFGLLFLLLLIVFITLQLT